MTKTVRARCVNGLLSPLEPLDLEEGAEVTLSVVAAEQPGAAEPAEAASPSANETDGKECTMEAFLGRMARIRDSVPPEAWDGMPTDFSKNKKHYLYGYPKAEV